jgi:Zn-dependent metalloprotease
MMRSFFALLLVLLLPGAVACGSADIPVRAEPVQIAVDLSSAEEDLSLEEIRALSGGRLEIVTDPRTGLPAQIEAVFSARKIFTAEDAVRSLFSVRTLMRIKGFAFACIDSESRESVNVFFLQQLHEGVPVFGGMFRVIAGKDGTPVSVSGTYKPGIVLDTRPSLSARAAGESVPLDFGMKLSEAGLEIYELSESDYRLCRKYYVKSKDKAKEKLVFVDAHSGEMIAELPLAI